MRAQGEADKKDGLMKKDIVTSEAPLSRNLTYDFHQDDLRIALFFLFFVQVGFFGTGKYVVSMILELMSDRPSALHL